LLDCFGTVHLYQIRRTHFDSIYIALRDVEKMGVPGLGHRRSFGGSRVQISPPRFLELAAPPPPLPAPSLRLRLASARRAVWKKICAPAFAKAPARQASTANEPERGSVSRSTSDLQTLQFFPNTYCLAKLLRVADPRSVL